MPGILDKNFFFVMALLCGYGFSVNWHNSP